VVGCAQGQDTPEHIGGEHTEYQGGVQPGYSEFSGEEDQIERVGVGGTGRSLVDGQRGRGQSQKGKAVADQVQRDCTAAERSHQALQSAHCVSSRRQRQPESAGEPEVAGGGSGRDKRRQNQE